METGREGDRKKRAPGWVGLLVGLSCFSFHCADSLRNPKARVHVDGLRRDGFGEAAWYRQEADAGVRVTIPPQREKVAAWKGG